jgi:HAD superfamily hydrolase (TIGR01459 family)
LRRAEKRLRRAKKSLTPAARADSRLSMTKLHSNDHALAGLGLIAGRYDAILCDIWGVVHNGVEQYRAATQALSHFRRMGKAVALITNAPRPWEGVRAQLDQFSVAPDVYDGIVTSGDVTAMLVAERMPGRPYHIGPDRDLPIYDQVAKLTGRIPERVAVEQADFAVCTGLVDDETETPEDYMPALTTMRAKNLTMICANPDLVVHRGDDLLYCAGALAERYEAMGGEVVHAGKPYAPIYRLALGRAERAFGRPLDLSRVLAIGDAMRTDVRGAVDMGLDSIFVTQGIHRDDLHGDDGALEQEAYRQFIETAGFAPDYTMARLEW